MNRLFIILAVISAFILTACRTTKEAATSNASFDDWARRMAVTFSDSLFIDKRLIPLAVASDMHQLVTVGVDDSDSTPSQLVPVAVRRVQVEITDTVHEEQADTTHQFRRYAKSPTTGSGETWKIFYYAVLFLISLIVFRYLFQHHRI